MLKTLITASLYVGALLVSVDAACDEIYEVYMVERNLSVDEARKCGVEISGFDAGKDGVEIYVKCTNSVSERLCESNKLLRKELYAADVSIGDAVTSLAIPKHGSEYSWHVTIPRESIAQSKLFLCYGYSQEYVQLSIGLDKVLCSQKEVMANANCVSDIPRLAVPPEGVAFGEIAAGESASKSIELRNVSSSPVAVSQVKGCCGADARLEPMRVEPGSAAKLSVSLKPMPPGEFSKQVQILCDDPESPVVTVDVSGVAVSATGEAPRGAPPCERAVQVCVAALLCAGAVFLLAKGRRRLSLGLSFEVAARVGIGGVFVYAGAMKLCDVGAFRELLSRYGMLPEFALGFVSVALPAFECVVGALLVFSRWVRPCASVISAMLVVFVVALAQAGIRGLDVSCGCFGGASSASGGVWTAVVRDIVFLVPSMYLAWRGRHG